MYGEAYGLSGIVREVGLVERPLFGRECRHLTEGDEVARMLAAVRDAELHRLGVHAAVALGRDGEGIALADVVERRYEPLVGLHPLRREEDDGLVTCRCRDGGVGRQHGRRGLPGIEYHRCDGRRIGGRTRAWERHNIGLRTQCNGIDGLTVEVVGGPPAKGACGKVVVRLEAVAVDEFLVPADGEVHVLINIGRDVIRIEDAVLEHDVYRGIAIDGDGLLILLEGTLGDVHHILSRWQRGYLGLTVDNLQFERTGRHLIYNREHLSVGRQPAVGRNIEHQVGILNIGH